jgi:hypothetical protein
MGTGGKILNNLSPDAVLTHNRNDKINSGEKPTFAQDGHGKLPGENPPGKGRGSPPPLRKGACFQGWPTAPLIVSEKFSDPPTPGKPDPEDGEALLGQKGSLGEEPRNRI